MEAMLAEKEEKYLRDVEKAKEQMLEASEYVAKVMKEQQLSMFKQMMTDRLHTTNEFVKGKKMAAEQAKRDAEEAAELWRFETFLLLGWVFFEDFPKNALKTYCLFFFRYTQFRFPF